MLRSFIMPDDAESLVHAVRAALQTNEQNERIVSRGSELAREHSWQNRAQRIIALITARTS